MRTSSPGRPLFYVLTTGKGRESGEAHPCCIACCRRLGCSSHFLISGTLHAASGGLCFHQFVQTHQAMVRAPVNPYRRTTHPLRHLLHPLIPQVEVSLPATWDVFGKMMALIIRPRQHDHLRPSSTVQTPVVGCPSKAGATFDRLSRPQP